MSDYRRWYVPGGTIFLTVVTYNRRRILTTDAGRRFLHAAIETVRKKRPFDFFASVLLPDHWHSIISLPAGDAGYPTRIKRIKEEFTREWLNAGLSEARVTAAQAENGERGIWQPRFWEHTVEDERDLEGFTDYIHWNPRKHGLVSRVRDWRWSSFHRLVTAGTYDLAWGGEQPRTFNATVDWGEP